jgi:hypothetical protein
MKYELETLPCPVCGKPPLVFKIYSTWEVVCPCSFWINGLDDEKFVAVSKWNSKALNYDPERPEAKPPKYLAEEAIKNCRQILINLERTHQYEIRTGTT